MDGVLTNKVAFFHARSVAVLKRLYVDNYKCMVNFEFVPQATQLILGANGAGKSSVFDVLLMLRRFITGQDRLEQLVDVSTLTAWEKRTQQTFV